MEEKLAEEKAKEGGMLQVRYRAYLWACFFFVQMAFASETATMMGLSLSEGGPHSSIADGIVGLQRSSKQEALQCLYSTRPKYRRSCIECETR